MEGVRVVRNAWAFGVSRSRLLDGLQVYTLLSASIPSSIVLLLSNYEVTPILF